MPILEDIEKNLPAFKENAITIDSLYNKCEGRYTYNSLVQGITCLFDNNLIHQEKRRGVRFFYSTSNEEATLRKKRIKNLNNEEKKQFEKCFIKGFRCKYCGRKMRIEYGYSTSFIIEHNISKFNGGIKDKTNIDIICGSCNTFKNSLNGNDFNKIVCAIKETWGETYFNKIIAHYDAHLEKILKGRVNAKAPSHRPKKEISLEKVKEYYKKGVTLAEIATIMKVSDSTLYKHLREANIILEPRDRGDLISAIKGEEKIKNESLLEFM